MRRKTVLGIAALLLMAASTGTVHTAPTANGHNCQGVSAAGGGNDNRGANANCARETPPHHAQN